MDIAYGLAQIWGSGIFLTYLCSYTVRQSWVEIEHYSISAKNELTVLIKALEFPRGSGKVSALFAASTSSYTHTRVAFTSGHYTCTTVNAW